MSETETTVDIALGQCRIRDGRLHIDRSDPETMGRVALVRAGLSQSIAYRPVRTMAMVGVFLVLVVLFVGILGFLYVSNPAVWPLVAILAAFGGLAVLLPLERAYRRALDQRRTLHERLAADLPLDRIDRVPIEDIRRVTVRDVSTGFMLADGTLLVLHVDSNGSPVATYLGFPRFMDEAAAKARSIFDQRGIPVESVESGGPDSAMSL